METLGMALEDVTHVITTHPHGDHYAGVAIEREGGIAPRFPWARHFLGRADWEGNHNRGQVDSPIGRLELIDSLGLLELVDEAREVAPGVTILPAPGETPGHTIVQVESGGERFYFLGDIVHLPCEVERLDWTPPSADRDALIPLRERVFTDVARENALLVTAHEAFPPWGRIVEDGDGFHWERC
jgi:glyoxylase-like metal-dependent hydrolase (beta-lactamase superfamily II)